MMQDIISIHVPAWGTTILKTYAQESKIFQSTFPRGERLMTDIKEAGLKLFQSTFPRGERPCNQCNQGFHIGISIHVPAWGTTDLSTKPDWCPLFQSTFPRGERQREAYENGFNDGISIHVPAWGTTRAQSCTDDLYAISIHVPAWGTTHDRH